MTRQSSPAPSHRAERIGEVSTEEACRICHIEIEFVHSLVMEGVFEVESDDPSSWRFNPNALADLRKATRLFHDLGVNPPGIALALELLKMLQRSRQRG
jgi:chaperone modulatory protein CbpM